MPFIPAAIGAVAGGIGAVGGAALGGIGAIAGGIGAALPAIGSGLIGALPSMLSMFGKNVQGGAGSQQGYSQGYSIPPLPVPPKLETAKAKATETIDNKRRAISRNKTIFTDPMGISEKDKSSTTLKTLTGV